MQRLIDGRGLIASAIGEVNRKGRALLPFLLAPCVPAMVACSTADVRADAGAQITPAVVARSGLPPLLLRPLSKNDAVALNQRIPFSAERQIPASAFAVGKDEVAGARALECLTSAVYYEAASEPEAGQQAVAQVILNRVRHPAFPASVCGVVFQGSTLRTGCQFSFTCDGSLLRVPSRKEWDRARGVATAALAGAVYAPVGLATHYHADYVVPYWAPSLAKATQVGAHIFYRWAGTWGRPPSFVQRYASAETDPSALRSVALISHRAWPTVGLPAEPRLTLAVDPDVELGGILRLLATTPESASGTYEKQVRAHFQSDTAASLLTMLTGGKAATPEPAAAPAVVPPVLATEPAAAVPLVAAAAPAPLSLAQMIADFAKQSKFSAFLRSRRTVYTATAKQVGRLAERAAVDWETYSGAPVSGGKAVLSLTQGLNDRACPALGLARPAGPVLRWPADPREIGPAEIFIGSGFADRSLQAPARADKRQAKQLRIVLEPVQDQVVAAVFARIAALSRGETTGAAMVRREVAQGHDLVPLLTQRLRFFEQHRGDYPTLNHFLPRLIAGIARPDSLAAPATGLCAPPA